MGIPITAPKPILFNTISVIRPIRMPNTIPIAYHAMSLLFNKTNRHVII